jgi:hypothetical protein
MPALPALLGAVLLGRVGGVGRMPVPAAVMAAKAALGGHQSRLESGGIDAMSDGRLRFVTAAGLVIGALLGMAGTFAPSARIRGGARLTALSAPLPFGAYPFLAIPLLGWAWAHIRTRPARNAAP